MAPHALCWTDQCFAGNGAADVKAVLEVQKGQVPRGVVNRDVLERTGFKAKLEELTANDSDDRNSPQDNAGMQEWQPERGHSQTGRKTW